VGSRKRKGLAEFAGGGKGAIFVVSSFNAAAAPDISSIG